MVHAPALGGVLVAIGYWAILYIDRFSTYGIEQLPITFVSALFFTIPAAVVAILVGALPGLLGGAALLLLGHFRAPTTIEFLVVAAAVAWLLGMFLNVAMGSHSVWYLPHAFACVGALCALALMPSIRRRGIVVPNEAPATRPPSNSWFLQDRIVARPRRFVAIASVFGPLISSFVIVGPLFFGSLPATALAPLALTTNVVLFCVASYFFGFLPALVASSILALRRNITVLEALVVAVGASFAAGALYGVFGLSNVPVYTGTSLALVAIPGAIGVGLLAAWWGVFAAPPQASRPLIEVAAP